VGVVLLRGCVGEKHNKSCIYGEMLRSVRVNVVKRRSIILHILSVCVCVCVCVRVALGIQHAKQMRCVM